MQWLKNKLFTHQYYKITKEGDQLSIFDSSPFEYILHIQNVDSLKYHFMKKEYKLTPYMIHGLSVCIDKVEYVLPAKEFAVQGNELFSETLTLWLCKHYLHIPPNTESVTTIIDKMMNLYTLRNNCKMI